VHASNVKGLFTYPLYPLNRREGTCEKFLAKTDPIVDPADDTMLDVDSAGDRVPANWNPDRFNNL